METTKTFDGSDGSLKSSTCTRAFTGVERIHFMDNVRAIALIAGILFHVGIGFSVVIKDVWMSSNTTASIGFDYWVWLLHTFRMPLFFLIAGFFAHLLIEKRGLGGFIKNRLLRITLPFFIFWPLIMAAIIGIVVYAATSMSVDNPIMQFIRMTMENPELAEGKEMPITTAHLWFLYYLTFFSILAALMVKYVPSQPILDRLLASPLVSFVGLPVIAFFALIRKPVPHPAPESFMPEFWAFVFFGLFFWYGYRLYKSVELYESLEKYCLYLLGSVCLASVLFNLYLPEPLTMATVELLKLPQELNTGQIVRAGTTAVLAWHMTFVCLVFGRRLLNRENRLMRYVSKGSYWAYIVHMPIVFYLQLLFNPIDLPLFIEFLVISSLTLAACYVSYSVLVKPTPIGWLLNGRGKK